jgi:gamma-glutamyl phosphate reductase
MAIQSALADTVIPPDAIQLVETHEEIKALLDLDKYIDLVIPRGSKSLVKYIQSNTRYSMMFWTKTIGYITFINILISAKKDTCFGTC